MKKTGVILFLLLALSWSAALAGQEVLVVQSMRVKPYESAFAGLKAGFPTRLHRLVLEESGPEQVLEKIRGIRPDVIVAIGGNALHALKPIHSIPIVYTMVLNPEQIAAPAGNVRGVSMRIPPQKQLSALLDVLPGISRIGLLYDPAHNGTFVSEAAAAAERTGLDLVARELRHAADAPAMIMDLKGKIDVFWMLPDKTVATPATIEFLLLFSLESHVPLFTFSEKYVEVGAFMSMDIDPYDMGLQAGEMARSIRSGDAGKHSGQEFARKAVVATNLMIARKIGLTPSLASLPGATLETRVFRQIQIVN